MLLISVPGACRFTGAGSINDSYATGTVTNTAGNLYFYGGGLAGHLIYGAIANSYSSTEVKQSGSISYSGLGGFIGTMTNAPFNTSINTSYFDNVASTQTTGVGIGDNLGPPHLTGLTTDGMKAASIMAAGISRIRGPSMLASMGLSYLRPGILTTDLPRAVKDDPYSIAIDAFDGAREACHGSPPDFPMAYR